MEILKFVYRDQEVEFQPHINQKITVNASQMALIFERRVADFLESKQTQDFIQAAIRKSIRDEDEKILTMEDLVVMKSFKPTYMHQRLALKFAAWLDPDFELWVYDTIQDLLNGNYHKNQRYNRDLILLKRDAQRIEDEILEASGRKEELNDIYAQIRLAKSLIRSVQKDDMKQLMLFDQPTT